MGDHDPGLLYCMRDRLYDRIVTFDGAQDEADSMAPRLRTTKGRLCTGKEF